MTTDGTASPVATRRPGRPRSARAEQAILDAALDLLVDVGYEATSIEGVAARAGVGKTTIYRRWPSKEDLVIAVLENLQVEAPLIDTGDLRSDLLALARAAAGDSIRSTIERLLPRLMTELPANPALFAVYREQNLAPRVGMMRAMIERAIARGDVRPGTSPEVVMSLFSGAFIAHSIFAQVGPMPPDFAEQVIETIWRGITAG